MSDRYGHSWHWFDRIQWHVCDHCHCINRGGNPQVEKKCPGAFSPQEKENNAILANIPTHANSNIMRNHRLLEAAGEEVRKELTSRLQKYSLIHHIDYQASRFFENCPYDYCVQSIGAMGDIIVFGGHNRVQWSVERGFQLWLSSCTPDFIAHAKKIQDWRSS